MAIPKAPVNRIIKEAGAERVSDAAVVALVEYLEADAAAVAKKAIEYAKIAKRQTVNCKKTNCKSRWYCISYRQRISKLTIL